MSDRYGTLLRERMKISMSEPSDPFRPLNRRAGGRKTFLRTSGTDRRGRWIKRLWWNYKSDIGLFAWMIAALLAGVLAWICFDGVEQWFR